MSNEESTPTVEPGEGADKAVTDAQEPAETEEPPAGISKGRMYLWAGAGLVAVYFIINGIIGVVKGDTPTDPATEGPFGVSISQHV